ncbi:MAG: ATP-binding protein [Syntrophobacteraceae bacterium]
MLYPARFMLVGAMNPCPCAMQATRQSHAPVIQGQY